MMENVIEKHYVPTSGSGLDANLVAALMNNNNKSLDPATVALLRDNDKGLETAALANGGGMFGGAAMWNNPFMYLVWMWMMRWMNGNGEWGNGQGLANQLNNDANTNLTIRAIDGNRDASAPQISATYDYDVFINHCNYVVPNIARTRNHAIVVSIRNSASA